MGNEAPYSRLDLHEVRTSASLELQYQRLEEAAPRAARRRDESETSLRKSFSVDGLEERAEQA